MAVTPASLLLLIAVSSPSTVVSAVMPSIFVPLTVKFSNALFNSFFALFNSSSVLYSMSFTSPSLTLFSHRLLPVLILFDWVDVIPRAFWSSFEPADICNVCLLSFAVNARISFESLPSPTVTVPTVTFSEPKALFSLFCKLFLKSSNFVISSLSPISSIFFVCPP